MTGMALPAGAGVHVNFGGEDLILSPLSVEDLGVIENKLREKRRSRDPIGMITKHLANMPPELAEKLATRAYEDAMKVDEIPAEEVAEWMDTLDGMSFTIWLALEKRYPARFSIKDCYAIMEKMAEDDLERLKQQQLMSSGLDERGNSSGPIPIQDDESRATETENETSTSGSGTSE